MAQSGSMANGRGRCQIIATLCAAVALSLLFFVSQTPSHIFVEYTGPLRTEQSDRIATFLSDRQRLTSRRENEETLREVDESRRTTELRDSSESDKSQSANVSKRKKFQTAISKLQRFSTAESPESTVATHGDKDEVATHRDKDERTDTSSMSSSFGSNGISERGSTISQSSSTSAAVASTLLETTTTTITVTTTLSTTIATTTTPLPTTTLATTTPKPETFKKNKKVVVSVSGEINFDTPVRAEEAPETSSSTAVQTTTPTTEATTTTPAMVVYASTEAYSDIDDGVEEMACKIPVLDPFDPSIAEHIWHYKTLTCKRLQPDLTYVDQYNYLHYNISELRRLQSKLKGHAAKMVCKYNTFERTENKTNDNSFTHDAEELLVENVPAPIHKDFVQVKCVVRRNRRTYEQKLDNGTTVTVEAKAVNLVIYFNIHPIAANRTIEYGDESEDQLSVLLFLIDSTSLSLARRNLPLTYEYLKNEMGTFFMEGYNKMSDNSFVNVIPWLINKRLYDQGPGFPAEVEEDLSKIQYDHWPLIWTNFSAKGYVTSFNEDTPYWGMFHYGARGFARKPVEHSYRPFWMSIYWDKYIGKNSTEFCYGNIPMPAIQLDIMRRLHQRYRGKLKWGYNFFTEIVHDYDWNLERVDQMFHDFLKEMHEGGYWNHTVLFFSSDHGHRFSPIRSTLVGLIEERLPMTSITVPRWFLEKHPKIARNLRINSKKRLTSNFDYYMNFKYILNGEYYSEQAPAGSRGLSWFYDIPANRTCADAGIPPQYCTCQDSVSANVTDKVVVEGGVQLVQLINNILSDYKDCVELTFTKVVHAEIFQVNQKVIHGFKEFEPPSDKANVTQKDAELKRIRLMIQVAPSNASFEATVQFNAIAKTYTLEGGITDIQRLDKYGSQSDCIPPSAKAQRKMCFCKKYLPSQ